jgi:urease accessory protein
MANHTTRTELKSLSRFLQILDGSFPSGAFVHSFGLEPHIIQQKVQNIEELRAYLYNLLIDQYLKFEFVHIQKMYEALSENKWQCIKKLDKQYGAYLTYEYAKASKDMGHNYWVQIEKWVSKANVKTYFNGIKNKTFVGNELSVLTAFAFELDMSVEEFMVLWAKKNLMNIAMCSLKISRIQPTQIQQVLFEFDEVLAKIKFNDVQNKITNFNPLFEEIIYAHKNLEPKMFTT